MQRQTNKSWKDIVCLFHNLSHSLELGLGFEPFLIKDTVFKKSAAGIEMTCGSIDVHTTERDIKMSLV